jgi:hypothetical protein
MTVHGFEVLVLSFKLYHFTKEQWFEKCGARPPGGTQQILKAGARGVKLFYLLKINKQG